MQTAWPTSGPRFESRITHIYVCMYVCIYIYIYIYIYEKGLRQSLASYEKGGRKVDANLTMLWRSILPPLSRWTSGLQWRAKINMISTLCTACTAYLQFYTRRWPSAAHLSNTAVLQLCTTFEHPWTDRRLGWAKLNSRNTLHWEGGGGRKMVYIKYW